MNKSVFVSCGDSKWDARTGETAEILRQLGPDEADVVDVGPMFRVRFCDGVETDVFVDELPDLEKYLFGEVVFDITTCAASILKGFQDARTSTEHDSRDLYASIFEWANEFNKRYPNLGNEYMSAIEEFACEKLSEYFDWED